MRTARHSHTQIHIHCTIFKELKLKSIIILNLILYHTIRHLQHMNRSNKKKCKRTENERNEERKKKARRLCRRKAEDSARERAVVIRRRGRGVSSLTSLIFCIRTLCVKTNAIATAAGVVAVVVVVGGGGGGEAAVFFLLVFH